MGADLRIDGGPKTGCPCLRGNFHRARRDRILLRYKRSGIGSQCSLARCDGECSLLAPCYGLYLLNGDILRNGRKIKRPLRRTLMSQTKQVSTNSHHKKELKQLIVFKRKPTCPCGAGPGRTFDKRVFVASPVHTR